MISRAVFIAALTLAVGPRSAAEPPVLHALSDPDPAREARVAWHREARFGCFVHWGVYSALGNEFEGRRGWIYAEHIMRALEIRRAVYLDQVARPFNPEKFDGETWVRLMRDAGLRYLVITAKHHDGFAMYPSRVSSYNLTAVTRFKRDPMAELKAACVKYGLKFGFYYSHAYDWEDPDAPGNDWEYGNPGGTRKIHGAAWWESDREFLARARCYVDRKALPQLRELIDQYHPDILWFDTPSTLPPDENRRILSAVRAMAPDVVVNGRLVADYGDYANSHDRPEHAVPMVGDWEAIPTTNDSYGYNRFDHAYKPAAHFIRLLAECVSKGGNMLMNIGPKGDGTIDTPDAAILRDIGRWMERNHESIYGCGRSGLPVQNWGISTRKAGRLYLHVFKLPTDGKLLVAGLGTDPANVVGLQQGPDAPRLHWHRISPRDIVIELPPPGVPNSVDVVLALDFPTEITTDPARLLVAGETTRLHVFDGTLVGPGVAYGDGKKGHDAIESWSSPEAGIRWPVRIEVAGPYQLRLVHRKLKPSDGGTFSVTVAAQELTVRTGSQPPCDAFVAQELGTLQLPRGEFDLLIKARAISGTNLMCLRELEIIGPHSRR